MKIENERDYDEALLFIDAFFEDTELYSKVDGLKVKEMLAAVSEYEKNQKNETDPPKNDRF
ncbi:hypothetical protein [Runella sp.]|uniref:hypothetical protein n=1 Tax=Runella sp. TaxID=1960881 RepID=UPI0030194106